MAYVSNPFILRLFINNSNNGWSERWPLLAADPAAALASAALLASARQNILCQGASIEWASVYQGSAPWPEQAAIGPALSALPQWGPDEVDSLGLLWRFETSLGAYGMHLFRAIDATEWTATDWIRSTMDLVPGIWPLPTAPAFCSKQDLLLNCFSSFRDLTGYLKLVGTFTGGAPKYLLSPWDLATFRMVSSRNPGRRYRRVSWESYWWGDTPAFSPCGEAVGVLRSCYSARCRWYANGAPHRIHYYWAAPGVKVLPLPHIFWGRYRDRDISNVTGPGEITGTFKRFWVDGTQFGVADGTHYTGVPNDFMGLTPVPWSPETPTPAGVRPACDKPAGLLAMYFGPDYFGRDYFGGDYFG